MMDGHESGEQETTVPDEGKKKIDGIDLSTLDPAVKDAIEEMIADNEALAEGLEKSVEAVTKAEEERDEAQAKLEEAANDGGDNGNDDEDDDISKLIEKTSDPATKRLLKKMHDENEASKAIAKSAVEKAEHERGQRVEKEFLSKVDAEMPNVTGAPKEDIAKALRFVSESNGDHYKVIETVLKSASEVIGKSELFKSTGKDDTSDVTKTGRDGVMEKINAKASELRKVDTKLTQEQAVAAVIASDAALYNEYKNLK